MPKPVAESSVIFLRKIVKINLPLTRKKAARSVRIFFFKKKKIRQNKAIVKVRLSSKLKRTITRSIKRDKLQKKVRLFMVFCFE